MKKIIFVSLLLAVFALAISMAMSVSKPIDADAGSESSAPPAVSASPTASDANVTVRVKTGETVVTMTMAQYLTGVVAAEMPAVFNLEALKAQAVAARTETLYHMNHISGTHPDADVCTDPADCQAYQDDAALRQKWGDAYSDYIKKVTDAVSATDGVCLTYDNTPIQAVFHSSSAGKTAASGEVWTASLPYLVSVTSPESSADVPNYVSSVTVTLSDFKETVLKYYPEAVFGKDSATWVSDITYTESGRVGTVKLGSVSVTGPVLRNMFGLRSTAASIKLDDKNVVFTTTGYGHGVGMSQYGANAFAQEGKTYKEILSWYYTGVTFSDELAFVKKT
ncbi:stage II sporulation protein D [Oscillospiraceae bacterium WX1]